MTQAIWIGGGTHYPAGIGDGQFNQLVLEHGCLSIQGVYDWASPAQFFPSKNTLGLRDTHVGTLPLYASLRILGLSADRAWQGWFIVVAALNAFAAFRLFAAVRIEQKLRGPLVFAGTASYLLVWAAGTHPQLLPFFPLLLAADQLARWKHDRVSLRWLAASGWMAWQFAAGPYLFFFGSVMALGVGVGMCAWMAWHLVGLREVERRTGFKTPSVHALAGSR